MKKKTVIISGASRGIGRACALRFAKEGYNLSLCSKNKISLLEELKFNLEDMGAEVLVKKCDVSKSEDIRDWVEETYKTYGRVDVLVSNAGVAHYSLLVNTSEEDFDRVMNTNLKGAFLLSKAVYDIMVSQKSGAMVFVSSIWGKYGASFESVYSASKGALIALSKSLAKELAPSNIRVNSVLAGVVNTDMLDNLSDNELFEMADKVAMQRIGKTQEIAEAIYFLASEKAAYITGTEIIVDGGFL